jgi:hypothetical protein
VLGATLTGLFGFLPGHPESAATPAPTWIDPSRQAVATFDDGQFLVGNDIQARHVRDDGPRRIAGLLLGAKRLDRRHGGVGSGQWSGIGGHPGRRDDQGD